MLESIILTLAVFSSLFSQHRVLPNLENLPTLEIGKVVFNIEIADSEVERAQGLSGRTSLPLDQGLLFEFSTANWPGFWMKDMNFPIDIVWINENWQIVDLTKNFEPKSYPQIIFPKSAVKYVLEINADLINKNDFKIGDEVIFKP